MGMWYIPNTSHLFPRVWNLYFLSVMLIFYFVMQCEETYLPEHMYDNKTMR